MASILLSITDNYKEWQVGQNPDVDKWLFMDSPGLIFAILIAYLTFVLKIGPAVMRTRQPLELRKSMIAYNGIQVLFSILLVCMSLRVDLPFNALFSSACHHRPQTPRTKALLATGAWWYFFAKLTELLDTVFFILRKRNRQITFLHVYHHSVTMVFSWCFLKYAPGEQGAMIGLLNSLVHVVMYTYYMIAAMGPAYKKYLWWKKYMTVIQMIQFCMMIAYLSLLVLSNCGYSRSVSYFFIVNAGVFLYLFSDFYRKSYKRGPTESTPAESSRSNGSLLNGSLNINNNGSIASAKHSIEFVDDVQAYSRITRDVELLNKGEKLRKMKDL